MPDQPNRPVPAALGADHGDLTRPPVGSGDEPVPSRPDRRRRPAPGPSRRLCRAGASGGGDHRPRRPADPADHPAAVRPALAAHLPGANRWPLSPSSPGRTWSGPSTPARGRCRTSLGRSRSGRPRPGRPIGRATRAGPEPVYSRSGGRTTSPLHQSTSGADSPAQTAGESAPSVSGWADLRPARSQATVDWSIHPVRLRTAPGSVAASIGGHR